MASIKVKPMLTRGGSPSPNQFIIYTSEGEYYQSYESIIAFRPRGAQPITLGEDWNYSRTTDRYRNQFLGEGIAETRRKLADGTYILDESL